jgi:emp24/gp25L/p24 family/GOLD
MGTTMRSKRLCALHVAALWALSALAFWAQTCSALTFDLEYGGRMCLIEDIPPLSNVRGSLRVTGGTGDMTLDLFVSDHHGVVYFHKADANAVKYSFKSGSFEAHTTMPYRFCVVHQAHPHAAPGMHVARRVSLSVRVDTPAFKEVVDSLAKGGHLSKIQESFQEVSNEVDALIARLDEIRVKEQTLTNINEDTSRTILRITVIAALFTVATGVLNFLNLKSFFKQKKLA